ncbi:mannose-1-phosphate guanylyltransferase/mannose-6-phosphate isomerase [Litoricolaceae bacterium]|nr:mannose-1-phosphate guanylyltransferase/mannose-6-phosphate isomerase [Litorivicinaceae bacterium]
MTTLVPVLLAGGSGTRLWPTSRKSYPKQFVDLTGSGDSLLQSSLKRSAVIPNARPWIIVTREEYRFLVAQQAKEAGVSIGPILLEPSARNTAPAIALAAFEALALHDSPKLLVQTADHHIKDLNAFGKVIGQAFQSKAPFVLFGVTPTHPETGYGYIECGEAQGDEFLVSSFTEKPDLETSEAYLKSGNYLWNSGMFMLDAQAYLDALKTFEPSVYEACEKAYQNALSDLDFKRVNNEAFGKSPSLSIDYAVMERVKNLHVIPYFGDWSDVGAWDAVITLANQDQAGNAIQGNGVLLESSNTLVRAESRLVTGIGLVNLIVIETRDAVLVADATKTQHVKDLVEVLKSQSRTEATEHQKMYRPWGSYETLVLGDRFQVKQIVVSPGASLSLQMHHHRAEHWVVVSGIAEVQVDEGIQMLAEDQSVYIPIGSKHRLTNPGKMPLILIEVQSGVYVGEDDIVRFDDDYGRHVEKEG